ncbi:hypothetical protein B6N60_04133 [Richelia sinica FACHB-800]|uniref:Uncharacterized protein n=1 Tax=Richelia sinica FACHB-800 TaxID=1357546 RepID=A0A975TCD0_9NOST|nr:hypothetical protein B6N60_04133 [Richelia sinica FACHB-800]
MIEKFAIKLLTKILQQVTVLKAFGCLSFMGEQINSNANVQILPVIEF